MLDAHIKFETKGPIAHVRLDRHDKKNAITEAMYDGMRKAVETSESDPATRVLVIASTGDDFTAGNDLGDFLRPPPVDGVSAAGRFLRTLCAAKKPIVAAVDGVAIGVGTTLLLHCDFVIATRNARFQLPFVNLALVPEAASTLLLPQRVGYVRAAELLMLGEPFDAQKALAMGIINQVVEAAELKPAVADLAARLASKAPSAMRHIKALMKSNRRDVEECMAEEGIVLARQFAQPETRQALEAFFARRTSNSRSL